MTFIRTDKTGDGKDVDKEAVMRRVHKSLNSLVYHKKKIFPRYLSYEKSVEILNAVLDELGCAISENELVIIPNFGRFLKLHKRERIGTHPKTNELITIPAKTTVVFRASKNLGKRHFADEDEFDYVND